MVGAALIAAFACPAQPAILVDRRPGVVRTSVVACSGGRRVLVRRSLLRRGRSGERIVAVAGNGRWVAWGVVRHRPDEVKVVVGTSRLAGGRARRRGALSDAPVRDAPPTFDLVLTSRGQPAWLIGRRVFARHWLRLDASFPTSRTARGPLVLEDDRTLRWSEPDGLLGFHELPDQGNTLCGRRAGFRFLAEGERVVVIERIYDERVRVLRACIRNEPDDPVAAQVRTDSPERLEVLGFHELDVVLKRTATGPGDACETVSLEVYDVDWDRTGRSPVSCALAPGPGTPLVVAGGRVAWIVESAGRAALYTAASDATLELDATGPGGITGLAGELNRLRWLHDGEPRSVSFIP
jgi:hypothetical protein